MVVTRNRERISNYLNYLKKEIDLLIPLLNNREVTQLHWGGGTPTHLNPDEINDLAKYIFKNFNISPNSENGCEIDPRELKKQHLEALRESGFNRISMGVQDLDERVQNAVNRFQPEEMTRKVISWIRELEFESINLDLMYGLPYQSVKSFEKSVDALIDISPDRIAVFNYAHVPWMKKHQELIKQEDLPDPEEKLHILKMTIQKLTDAGYVFIGMDHFAKPEDELSIALREKNLYRNFQGYSTHAGTDLYAMGITSISQIGNIFAQNFKTEKEYFSAIDQPSLPIMKGYSLNEDDIIRREVITRIMCDFELDFQSIESQFNIKFKDYFRWGLNNLKEMVSDGIIELYEYKLNITEMGRLLVRNVAMNFDGFIERKVDDGKYSRTV
jgi:oxygen-independent coproporphyrinogen-3 oxidase